MPSLVRRPHRVLLAAALTAFSAGAQGPPDARIERWVAAYGERELPLVRRLDALLPGDALLKTGAVELRTLIQSRGFAPEGRDQERWERTWRRFQDVQRGFTYGWNDDGERFRPIARGTLGPPPPPGPVFFAGLLESEPNDTLALANPMTCADTMDGTISPAFDDDVFSITIQRATFFSATVQPAGANPITDPMLTVMNLAGDVIAFNDDFNGLFPQIDILLPPGTYFFVVEGFSFRTGSYRFDPRCSTPQRLACPNALAVGTLLPRRPQAFLLAIDRLDEISVEVRHANGTNAAYLARLFSQDGASLILDDADGTLPGEVRFTTGLDPGEYPLILENRSQAAGDFTVVSTCTNQGVPDLICSAAPVVVAPDRDLYPTLRIQPGTLQLADFTLTDRALPDGVDWRAEDSTGRALEQGSTFGATTSAFRSVMGAGGLLRLADRPGGSVATWRDTPAAIRWCRPAATGGYAGPTDETVTSGPAFAFVDEHVDANGRIRLRKYETCRFVTGGSWDVGWYVDHLILEVNGQALRLETASVQNTGSVTFSSVGMLNGPSDTWTDDGVYLAVNFVDQNQAGQAILMLELGFDASALGITGSQIQTLRLVAEWYFAGHADVGVVAPPHVDDSSEEFDVLSRRIEILRSGLGTWDPLFDVAGGASTTPTGANLVDVSVACRTFPVGVELSAEDAARGTLANPGDQVGHLFRVRSPITATFRTDNGSSAGTPQRWRDDPYANDWSLPSAQYPGPIAQTSLASWPADVVGPGGTLRVRLRKRACWVDSTWDDAHYYDQVALVLDEGQGPRTHHPVQWSLEGDLAKFAATGILFANGLADLAANDGVYGRSYWDDFDATTHGPTAEYADVFDFDVSSQLAAGAGQLIQSLSLTLEVYLAGDGFSSIPNVVDSSEEQFLVALDVELFDWNAGTWLDLSPQPIVDPQRYASPLDCSSTAFLDPYARVFRASPFVLVDEDDDSAPGGNGRDALVRARLGDPATGVEAVAVVVSASPFAGPTETVGGYRLITKAPFGFGGDAPFEIGLGGMLVVRLRGNPGHFAVAFHTFRPYLPPVALGAPFEGFLTLDASALITDGPSGLVGATGTLEIGVPIPNSPVLVGQPIWSQGLLAHPQFTIIRFTNEDSVIVR